MRKLVKNIIVGSLLYSGFNALVGFFARRHVYVVGYHSVGNVAQPAHHEDIYAHLTIASDVFTAHLQYLKDNGHTFVSMDDVVNGTATGPKPTLIYFDDGFKNVETVAWPILKRFKAPTIVFVTPGLLDNTTTRLPRFAEVGEISTDKLKEIFMSWDDIKRLHAEGMQFGAHGLTHKKLTECTHEELKDELFLPRQRMSSEAGLSCSFLSYPHGRYNAGIIALAKDAGYKAAMATHECWNTKAGIAAIPFAINKIAPKPYDDMRMFKLKVYSWNLVKRIEGIWS